MASNGMTLSCKGADENGLFLPAPPLGYTGAMSENPYQPPTAPQSTPQIAPVSRFRARVGLWLYAAAFVAGLYAAAGFSVAWSNFHSHKDRDNPLLLVALFSVPSALTIALAWGGYRLRHK